MGDASPTAARAVRTQIRKARSRSLSLAMEETEQAIAETGSGGMTSDATLKASRKGPRSVNRGSLPSHLPREEIVIEPEDTSCPCCDGAMHVMGEARSERLDVIPASSK